MYFVKGRGARISSGRSLAGNVRLDDYYRQDTKIIWGRSGSRCAFCRAKLIMDATPEDDESVVGDECHIVSGKPIGPRYDSEYPVEEIDSYLNLILMCRVHHKMVDDQAETFTADILHQHESWVVQALELAAFSENLSVTSSIGSTFLKVKESMPELISEMKEDLSKEGNFFIVQYSKQ